MHPIRCILLLCLCATIVQCASPSAAFGDDLSKLKKDFEKALGGGKNDEATDLLGKIAATGGDEAREYLYKVGLEYSFGKDFYTALAGHLRSFPGMVEYVQARFKAGKPEEQVYAADILSGIDTPESASALAGFLAEDNEYARMTAVEGLMKLKRREGVLPLIDLLEELLKKRKDVLFYMVEDALWRLTAQDYEMIEDWRNWWATQPETFNPKNVFDEAGKDGATRVARKNREQDPEFFGTPIRSKNFVLIIDTSGTMRYVERHDIPGLARGDGSDGGGSSGGGQMTPDDDRLAQFWTRLGMAKRELEKLVRQMSPDTVFNIVRFSTGVDKFKKGSVAANEGTKKAAIKWAQDLKYDQKMGTNTKKAIEEAFKCDPKTTAIYFLSDGLPSMDGKTLDPTGPILDRIFELNRFRKIKLYTFGFNPRTYGSSGQPHPELESANQWLRKVAAETGGTFTEMRVDPDCTPDDPFGERKKKKKKDKEKKEGDGKDGDDKKSVASRREDDLLLLLPVDLVQ